MSKTSVAVFLLLDAARPSCVAGRGRGRVGSSRGTGGALDLPAAIQDNSLLIEEAFNQEPGVVQHINVFLRDLRTNRWFANFTQEYPIGGVRHQASYTIPYQRVDTGADSPSGLGDVALNYRYQLVGNGESRVAVAPRLTVFLPTGESRKGLGAGSTGVQIAVPLSMAFSETWVGHANVGATFTRSTRRTLSATTWARASSGLVEARSTASSRSSGRTLRSSGASTGRSDRRVS